MYIENPKTKGSGIICAIPQRGACPIKCKDCFFQEGRSYLEPLSENLPNLPTRQQSLGRIVRFNDGNDSNVFSELVKSAAVLYDDYFFNTSIPELEHFKAPVVLTVNPAAMTDRYFHKVEPVPKNLMFVRARVNRWNLDLIDDIIGFYTWKGVPVVLTYMAYYKEDIPERYKQDYVWEKRITNSYYVLSEEAMKCIETMREEDELVYSCGKLCKECGHCIREYYNTKERLRNE